MHEEVRGAKLTGRVLFQDADIYAPGTDPVEVRRRVGMVFQRPTPFPTMTVLDNATAGLRLGSRLSKSELRLRGEAKHELWIAADTRESDVAVYLDSWRRKIERVGTMNFPDVARREKLSGTPVIEVTIGADGKLLQTVVRRSSGHAEIDEAAMRILKLAAPFDPFPADLTVKHDEIRIAYEWQFLGGASQGAGVFYAEPPGRVEPGK